MFGRRRKKGRRRIDEATPKPTNQNRE